MTPYGDMDLCNIGSGNGLLPGTKPLPESRLTNHLLGHLAIIWEYFTSAMNLMYNVFRYYPLKLLPYLPGVNELRQEREKILTRILYLN